MFGCALLSAVALGACSTEELRPANTVFVAQSIDSSVGGVGIVVIRDDAYTQDTLVARNLPPYSVMVDGQFAAWDETFYVQALNSAVSFTLSAGPHVFGLADDQGRVAITTRPIEAKPGFDVVNPSFNPWVIFYGGATSLRARVLTDDPTAVPAGSVHLRVMNALADHQPIQVVQCPADLNGPTTAGSCTPLGAPIAYGDVYEANFGADVANRIGYYWAAPGAVGSVVQPINRPESFLSTVIPTQVQGPTGSCPSCVWTNF
jgi:hypothetical protein